LLIESQHPRLVTYSKLIITSITYYNSPQGVEFGYKKDDEKIGVKKLCSLMIYDCTSVL